MRGSFASVAMLDQRESECSCFPGACLGKVDHVGPAAEEHGDDFLLDWSWRGKIQGRESFKDIIPQADGFKCIHGGDICCDEED